jgi:hypothetical protein
MAEENEVVDDKELQTTAEAEVEGHDDDHHNEEEDNILAASDESTDDGEGDPDETAEERRLRNRKMREERKQRRKEREESYKRELASRDALIQEQNERLAALERRTQGADMAAIDNAMKQSADAYNHFKQQIALATERADGAAMADATEQMLTAQRRFEQLANIKQQAVRRQNAPQPLDARLVNHAKTWMDNNKWYDPSGKDEDSSIALSIDARLAAEGFDPRHESYWNELDARVKKYLPHRFNSGYNNQSRNSRPPVAGSGRESAPNGSKGTYKLSPERVQALKDLGQWDDPKARAEAIRYYQNYDKQHGA